MTLELYLDDGEVLHVNRNVKHVLTSLIYGREEFVVYDLDNHIRRYVNRRKIVRIEEAML